MHYVTATGTTSYKYIQYEYCMLPVAYAYHMIDPFPTPQLFYTYFYNHARRLRVQKLLYIELPRSFNGLQVAV